MATDTQNTILSNIIAAIPELTSVSDTAIFKKIAEVIGNTDDLMTTEIYNTETIIINTLVDKNYGKSGYYIKKALAYQDGYDLTMDSNGYPIYATIDKTAQIVANASFQAINNNLFLLVTAIDLSGNLIPLANDVLMRFKSYFQNFEIPGIVLTIKSPVANIFDFVPKITYLSTSNLSTIISNIQTQFANFQKQSLQNGILYVNQFTNYLVQNIEGLIDVTIVNQNIDGVAFIADTLLSSGYFNYSSSALIEMANQSNYTAINN